MDIVYLEFRISILDTVLIDKLMKYRLNTCTVKGIENNCWTQNAVTNGTKSTLKPITGYHLWYYTLGVNSVKIHRSIFISHLSDGTEHCFSRFAGDAKLQGGVADMPSDCPDILRNLEELEKRDSRNLVKFITGKHKALYLGRNHLMDQRTLWGAWLETSFMRKGMRVLVVETKPATHSHSKEGQRKLGLYEEECCQQFKGGDPFLLLSPGGTHVECWVHSWGPQHNRDTETLEQVRWKGRKMIKAWRIWHKIVAILWPGEVFSTKICNCCVI